MWSMPLVTQQVKGSSQNEMNGCHGDSCNKCTCQAWDQVHWYLCISTLSTAMKVLVFIVKSFLYF